METTKRVCMNCIKRLEPLDYKYGVERRMNFFSMQYGFDDEELDISESDFETFNESPDPDTIAHGFQYCCECGTKIEEITLQQYQMLLADCEESSCYHCKKKVNRFHKFCPFCGQHLSLGQSEWLQIQLAYCPDCHIDCATLDDIVSKDDNYRFCERHLKSLVIMKMPNQQCSCGHTYPAWLACCGHCGTPNQNQKSEQSILNLLKSGE